MKFGQIVFLNEMLDNRKMSHVGSKTRSPGQILEKPCVCSPGHIFNLIIIKLDQHLCLDEISHKFENGSYPDKN